MPAQRRAEVHRLHLKLLNTADPTLRKEMAERALELAQQAEAIESLPNDVKGLCVSIAHYSSRLAAERDQHGQRALAELLQAVEEKLEQVSSPRRSPRPHRVAAA